MSTPLSLNALLVSPARLRWQALRALWHYRSCVLLPIPAARMRAERSQEMLETMPVVMVLALIAAALIFIVMPSALSEQTNSVLASVWPAWVVQAAPMVIAQSLAMLNAPTMALHLVELQESDALPDDSTQRQLRIAAHAVPQIVAHAWVAAACSCLLVMFSLLFGVVAELVLAIGDLRSIVTTVLASTSPWAWLRALAQAAVLGAVCALSAILFAWPGLQRARNAKESHRIGVSAMIVASAACALAGLAMNWLANLLGWRPEILSAF